MFREVFTVDDIEAIAKELAYLYTRIKRADLTSFTLDEAGLLYRACEEVDRAGASFSRLVGTRRRRERGA